ncbi:3-methyl-2-oxobutanoate hydroxymethyltransferase [bacterium]|nr:MAG: 3-methyl-2-oxobutanoate hydroxymethyltransferase [bacterium]
MGKRVAVPSLRAMRASGQRIVCVTAYDATFGALADEAGVDLVLVGDSVANTLLGMPNTVGIGLEEMAHHVRATRAGVKGALLVADLPFGSYGASVAQAVESAATLMKAGAEAVKLEGDHPDAIAACTMAGIPVMGHLGFTPQSVNLFGGHKVQGKGDAGDAIVAQAQRMNDAGAFGVVLELVPATLAERLTREVDIPTIGIGAGTGCNGQVQVLHDVLGLSERVYKHAKPYLDGRDLIASALRSYAQEVRAGSFPTEANAS